MTEDPTIRFSDRVEAYVRYRPSYPPEVFDLLESACALRPPQPVADIGSGTGILTRPLLERGHPVFAVEPNRAMRQAAERQLSGFAGFVSVDGTAEATTLADRSVLCIVSAQAFHWFDLDRSASEFRRILQSQGRVAIIWNDRRKDSTAFLRAYERLLLKHGTDYELVDHGRIGGKELTRLFGTGGFLEARFDNRQILDYEGLEGRLESSSYTPRIGTPEHARMLDDLQRLFDTHNTDGRVSLDYDTLVYYGRLES